MCFNWPHIQLALLVIKWSFIFISGVLWISWVFCSSSWSWDTLWRDWDHPFLRVMMVPAPTYLLINLLVFLFTC